MWVWHFVVFIGLRALGITWCAESDIFWLSVVLKQCSCTCCDTLRLVGHRAFYLINTQSVVYNFFISEHSKLCNNSSSIVWDETTLDQVICEQSGSNGCVILWIAAYQYQTLCYFLWFPWRQFIILWWLFKHKPSQVGLRLILLTRYYSSTLVAVGNRSWESRQLFKIQI